MLRRKDIGMSRIKDWLFASDDVPDRAADWDRLIGTDEEERGPVEDRPEWDGNPGGFPHDGKELPF